MSKKEMIVNELERMPEPLLAEVLDFVIFLKSKYRKEKSEAVSIDTVYSEMYAEMRRFRDYQLTVSTWFTTVLLAILTAILVSLGRSDLPDLLKNKYVFYAAVVLPTVIGVSGCLTAIYAHKRYHDVRKYVDDNKVEPPWHNIPPSRKPIPLWSILVTLSLVSISIVSLLVSLYGSTQGVIMTALAVATIIFALTNSLYYRSK